MVLTRSQLEVFFVSFERKRLHQPGAVAAGVLMPFFEKDGEMHLLLTKRTDSVEHHKGQISFPGGVRDADDVDIVATALREAEEEIGLTPASVKVLGTFDDVWTPTGFLMTPVVGFIKDLPSFRINTAEVAAILEVPVPLFLDSTKIRVETRMRSGKAFQVYFYSFEGVEIWGATAWIIRSFLEAAGVSRVE